MCSSNPAASSRPSSTHGSVCCVSGHMTFTGTSGRFFYPLYRQKDVTSLSSTRLRVGLPSSSRVSAAGALRVSGSRRPRPPAVRPLRQNTVKGMEAWTVRCNTHTNHQVSQSGFSYRFLQVSHFNPEGKTKMWLKAADRISMRHTNRFKHELFSSVPLLQLAGLCLCQE